MEVVIKVAVAGGLFAVLTFIHFFVDWVFQSHSEAMVKHNNPKVRAKHCLIYTAGFIPFMWYLDYTWFGWLVCLNVLFWSHFYLDTYHLVFLWAKHIRCPPEMTDPYKELCSSIDEKQHFKVSVPNAKKGFVEFIQTTLGKILLISIDQISHLSFLWVLVLFAMIK